MYDENGLSNKEMLARAVKVLRARRGLSQIDLAKKSGVSQCTIGLLEGKGSRMPSVDTLIKLATALEVGEEELLKYLK